MAAIDPGGGGGGAPTVVTLLLMYIDGGTSPFDAMQYALKTWAQLAADTWSQSGLG